MRKKDWLPSNHQDLYDQANMTTDYLIAANLERIGITGNALNWYNTDYIPKHDAFNLAFEDWKDPAERTTTKIAVLGDAEKLFSVSYRALYGGYLSKNPLVTDADLVEMGLPRRASGGKTPPTPPTAVVEAETDTSIPATVIINYRQKGKKGIAKPKGVHGVEILSDVFDAPVTDWALLTTSSFDTRTPAKFTFLSGQRGKTLCFALRYENNVGDKGPLSDIYTVIIP
ncbi:MAG: hypothetical protein LBH60_02740 [Prevotellaceae bacterium]|jgi:hypothetical protein|nr:hypothetical protein [Prevotellaceae bacterium]